MCNIIAQLMPIVFAICLAGWSSPVCGQDLPVSEIAPRATEWSIEDVGRWAAAYAPTANLLEIENRAVNRTINRDNDQQRVAVGLIQAVNKELGLHQRQQAAGEASDVYYQIVAALEQLQVLEQASPRLDSLEGLAEKAERLELPDGDRNQLADRRLQMEDRWYQADFGRNRLRNQLAGLVGPDHNYDDQVVLTSPLSRLNVLDLNPDVHIIEAHATRHDLKAIEVLCRCLSEDSLPVARQLIGTLVPGAGLEAIAKSRGAAQLLALHGGGLDGNDLSCRRQQCEQLATASRSQIAAEVRDAVLRIREAQARLGVANRRAELQRTIAASVTRAIDLEQAPPGSDQLAEIEYLERKSLVVDRQLELARAIVALQKTKGLLLY